MVTVDLVVFALDRGELRSLLIKRKKDPYADHWAIPGGYVEIDERIESAARRELKEETGLEAPAILEPIGVFDAPDRDPRGRTISHPFAALMPPPLPSVQGADDAAEAAWLDPRAAAPLAFDHADIMRKAIEWLQRSTIAGNKLLALLPRTFTKADVRASRKAIGLPARGEAGWIANLMRHGTIVEVEPGRYASS